MIQSVVQGLKQSIGKDILSTVELKNPCPLVSLPKDDDPEENKKTCYADEYIKDLWSNFAREAIAYEEYSKAQAAIKLKEREADKLLMQ